MTPSEAPGSTRHLLRRPAGQGHWHLTEKWVEVPIEAQPGDRDATPTLPDPLWSVLKAKFPALKDLMV